MSLAQQTLGTTPIARWLGARVWGVEHAFERARASGKFADDTKLRILFVLALFAVGFTALAMGATRAALFSDVARNGGAVASASVAASK